MVRGTDQSPVVALPGIVQLEGISLLASDHFGRSVLWYTLQGGVSDLLPLLASIPPHPVDMEMESHFEL